jgi:hypothetical protein
MAKPSKTFPEKVLYDLKLRVKDLLDADLASVAAIGTARGEF